MEIQKSEEEWKKNLSPEEFEVLRNKATEQAFTGEYWNNFETGIYSCRACGAELFSSKTKYDAGCGWPSFYEALHSDAVNYIEDNSHGMHRTEVTCKRCGGHLGHIFPDGPEPTGERFCINSLSIKFKPS